MSAVVPMEVVPVTLPSAVQREVSSWTLHRWLVKLRAKVYRLQPVAILKSDQGSTMHALAPHEGEIKSLDLKEGSRLQAITPQIAKVEFCPHSVVYGGLCALCGQIADPPHYNNVRANRLSVDEQNSVALRISKKEAESVSSVAARRLFNMNKLSLVLDLDHTLVHAVDDMRAKYLLTLHPHDDSIVEFSFSTLPHSVTTMFLKFRPNLNNFLQTVSSMFQLHIYTMGSRRYADTVASLIDPDKKLFGGRIVSRDDFSEGKFNQKNIKRLFPHDDSMAVVIDDREDVWIEGTGADHLPNLIRAAPYYFWDGMTEAYDRVSGTGRMRAKNEMHLPTPLVSHVNGNGQPLNGKRAPHEMEKQQQRNLEGENGAKLKQEDCQSAAPLTENGRGPGEKVLVNESEMRTATTKLKRSSSAMEVDLPSPSKRPRTHPTSVLRNGRVDSSVVSVSPNGMKADRLANPSMKVSPDAPTDTDRKQQYTPKVASEPPTPASEPSNGRKQTPTSGKLESANNLDQQNVKEAKEVGSRGSVRNEECVKGIASPERSNAMASEATNTSSPEPPPSVPRVGAVAVTAASQHNPHSALTERLRKDVARWWERDASPETSGHLLRLAEILQECHSRFFNSPAALKLKESLANNSSGIFKPPADVKLILASMRKQVLKDCVITFSGVVPLNVDPSRSPEWKLAERLGATCSKEFVAGYTTHVVTADERSITTKKCRDALESKCTYVVPLKWLYYSSWTFRRQREVSFGFNAAHFGPMLEKALEYQNFIKENYRRKADELRKQDEARVLQASGANNANGVAADVREVVGDDEMLAAMDFAMESDEE